MTEELSEKKIVDRLKEMFKDLIKGFCNLHRLDDVAGILGGKPIMVNEVIFSIIHDVETHPDMVFIYTDFGKVPPDRAAEAYAALLETNLWLQRVSGTTFAASPSTGKVVLTEIFPLVILTPEFLENLMTHNAINAKKWRTNYFLGKEGESAKQGIQREIEAQSSRKRLYKQFAVAEDKGR